MISFFEPLFSIQCLSSKRPSSLDGDIFRSGRARDPLCEHATRWVQSLHCTRLALPNNAPAHMPAMRAVDVLAHLSKNSTARFFQSLDNSSPVAL